VTIFTASWVSIFSRSEAHVAKVDADDYALWATIKGLPTDIREGRAMDVLAFIADNHVPHTTDAGEEGFDEHRHFALDPIPEEYREKQRELAVFLFNMNNGPCATVKDWLDEYGDTDYYANYMADAEEILKLQPHLLSLPTREHMGIE